MTRPITDFTPVELAEALGLKPFQARQLFHWIYRKRVFNFDAMTNLSKALREELSASWSCTQITPIETSESPKSGTKKVLFALADGETVEAVLLRHEDRITLCLSTQVGCPVACAFCATGRSGFRRNLSAGEIVEQALRLLEPEDLGERTPNVVYMGMGEPFLNYDAVVRSLRLLMSPDGLGAGARKITVSTVGHVPGIRQFAYEDWQVRLSVSLHAANDALRSRLVPMNRTYPLGALVDALREYVEVTGRQFTFEWTLLDGVNDSTADAAELVKLMDGLKASVNLIPYNPVDGSGFAPPGHRKCEAFRDVLVGRGFDATLRQERGQDVDGACGQLRCRTLGKPQGT